MRLNSSVYVFLSHLDHYISFLYCKLFLRLQNIAGRLQNCLKSCVPCVLKWTSCNLYEFKWNIDQNLRLCLAERWTIIRVYFFPWFFFFKYNLAMVNSARKKLQCTRPINEVLTRNTVFLLGLFVMLFNVFECIANITLLRWTAFAFFQYILYMLTLIIYILLVLSMCRIITFYFIFFFELKTQSER